MENNNYVFVYGLFRDQARKMLGEDAKLIKRTSINGIMYKVNDFYPGVVLSKKSKVWGDLFQINPNLLDKLDEWEGDEYKRDIIQTTDGIKCWAWIWIRDVKDYEIIKGGDWYLR
jgi:gamma-glutamylcyclotransferase (GGCT)/AIG2-like uncharacterized protein YtfP